MAISFLATKECTLFVTGGLYVVMGKCRLEATNRPAVLYQRIVLERIGNPVVWARDEDEFLDGGFTQVYLSEDMFDAQHVS